MRPTAGGRRVSAKRNTFHHPMASSSQQQNTTPITSRSLPRTSYGRKRAADAAANQAEEPRAKRASVMHTTAMNQRTVPLRQVDNNRSLPAGLIGRQRTQREIAEERERRAQESADSYDSSRCSFSEDGNSEAGSSPERNPPLVEVGILSRRPELQKTPVPLPSTALLPSTARALDVDESSIKWPTEEEPIWANLGAEVYVEDTPLYTFDPDDYFLAFICAADGHAVHLVAKKKSDIDCFHRSPHLCEIELFDNRFYVEEPFEMMKWKVERDPVSMRLLHIYEKAIQDEQFEAEMAEWRALNADLMEAPEALEERIDRLQLTADELKIVDLLLSLETSSSSVGNTPGTSPSSVSASSEGQSTSKQADEFDEEDGEWEEEVIDVSACLDAFPAECDPVSGRFRDSQLNKIHWEAGLEGFFASTQPIVDLETILGPEPLRTLDEFCDLMDFCAKQQELEKEDKHPVRAATIDEEINALHEDFPMNLLFAADYETSPEVLRFVGQLHATAQFVDEGAEEFPMDLESVCEKPKVCLDMRRYFF